MQSPKTYEVILEMLRQYISKISKQNYFEHVTELKWIN
jgi:hypothetical protein